MNGGSDVIAIVDGYSSTGTTFDTSSAGGKIAHHITTTWNRYWVVYTFGTSGTITSKSVTIRIFQGVNGTYIAGVKLEKGNKATAWCPSTTDDPNYFNNIVDSSGYGHNGTVTGSIASSSISTRHDTGTEVLNNATVITANPPAHTYGDQFSFSAWVYPKERVTASKFIEMRLSDQLLFNFGADAASAYQFFIFRPSYYLKLAMSAASMPLNEWHM